MVEIRPPWLAVPPSRNSGGLGPCADRILNRPSAACPALLWQVPEEHVGPVVDLMGQRKAQMVDMSSGVGEACRPCCRPGASLRRCCRCSATAAAVDAAAAEAGAAAAAAGLGWIWAAASARASAWIAQPLTPRTLLPLSSPALRRGHVTHHVQDPHPRPAGPAECHAHGHQGHGGAQHARGGVREGPAGPRQQAQGDHITPWPLPLLRRLAPQPPCCGPGPCALLAPLAHSLPPQLRALGR